MTLREYTMKRMLPALIVLVIGTNVSWGSWLSNGKYAGEFLSLGVDARALGMGGAYVAQATGASAAYWNPAGLAYISRNELNLMHAEQFDGIVGYDFGSYAQPSKGETGGWGFGAIHLGVGDIPVTVLEDPNSPIGPNNRVNIAHQTSDTELALFAGFGRVLTRWGGGKIAYGASAKIVGKWLYNESAYGLGFDLGIRYTPRTNVAIGVLLQDATTTAVIWSTGQKELIAPTLKLGGAWQVDIPKLIARITVAADMDLRFTDRGKADQFQMGAITGDSHLGLEYFINVSGTGIALRGGTEPSRDADKGFFANYTFGAGLLFRSFHVDYAFLAHPELGDTHRIALSLLWGQRGPKPEADN
jgi:hypothetical protein